MDKIIFHWNGGNYKPNKIDLEHYHFLIDDTGKVYKGCYTPEDNINCYDGKYAQHTGGGNTGAIGIALCGMYNFISRSKSSKYPLTKIQCEASFKLAAQLCKKYNISIDKIQTHYGFGKRNPKTTSFGKIDIIYLPPYPDVLQNDIEDFIRNKVKWYYNKL